MVQLEILSGKQAGSSLDVVRFPFTIGRAKSDHLTFEESGIWEAHLTIEYHEERGFLLSRHPDALATVNDEKIDSVQLRPGDTVEMGPVKLRFWLKRVNQRTHRTCEWLVWVLLALVTAGQVALMIWLMNS